MSVLNNRFYNIYFNFLNNLAKSLTKFYYLKLNKSFRVVNKSKNKGYDPVTSADKAFEKFIRYKINKHFPEHEIVGEEFGFKKSNSEFKWVIDPIDGTRSFVIGNPTWSNLISLNYNNKPIMGLANFPLLNKYYISNKKLSFVVEKNKKKIIKTNKLANINSFKLSGNFNGYMSLSNQKKIPKIIKLMNFPCTDALSYCHLCEGKIDSVIQCSNKIWDIHPLIPIITNAGGFVNTWDNKDSIKAGNIIVSSNKKIHNHVIKLLKPVSKI